MCKNLVYLTNEDQIKSEARLDLDKAATLHAVSRRRSPGRSSFKYLHFKYISYINKSHLYILHYSMTAPQSGIRKHDN